MSITPQKRKIKDIPKEYFEKEYLENKKTTVEIAKELNCTAGTVGGMLKRYGIAARKSFIDITGQRFGSLIAKRLICKNNRSTTWECQCDCGKIKNVTCSNLRSKGCLSCGCRKRIHKINVENSWWRGYGEISHSFVNKLKWSAEKQGIEYDVDLPYMWELFLAQERKCKLTGIDLTLPKKCKDYSYNASLDRIRPGIGYIEGNLQWVTKDANSSKGILEQEEYIRLCDLIINKRLEHTDCTNEYDIEAVKRQLLNIRYRTIHRKKLVGLKHDIDIDYIRDLYKHQDGRCVISNLPIAFVVNNCTASIDRIDSTLGYSKDNVQLLHKNINIMKWDFSTEYFINLCRSVSDFQRNKNGRSNLQ